MSWMLLLWACTGTPDSGSPDTQEPLDSGEPSEDTCTTPEPDLSGCLVQQWTASPRTLGEPDVDLLWYDNAGRELASWGRSGDESDEEARVCRQTWEEPDQLVLVQCWGSAVYTYASTWEDGLLTSRTYDRDADGSPERVWTYTYEDGLLVLEQWDNDLDGEADGSISYTWEDGLLVSSWSDYQQDGEPDETARWEHDDQGNIVLEELDQDGDGTPDERTTTTWDAEGNPLSREVDIGANDSWDERISWTWEDCRNTRIDTLLVSGQQEHTLRWWEEDRLVLEADHLDANEGWDERRAWTYTCPADEDAPSPPGD